MTSRNSGRFAAVIILSTLLSLEVISGRGYFRATTFQDQEFYFLLSIGLVALFLWIFFTVIDSLVTLAVPPIRTA